MDEMLAYRLPKETIGDDQIKHKCQREELLNLIEVVHVDSLYLCGMAYLNMENINLFSANVWPASLLKMSLFHRCFSNISLVKTNYLVYP